MKAYERLLRYISYQTSSDSSSASVPSTLGQLEFGAALASEMRDLGMENVSQTSEGIVYGSIPKTADAVALGFIAHMDVSSAEPSVNIKPRIVRSYDGGEIALNEEISMSAQDTPALKHCVTEIPTPHPSGQSHSR